MKFLHLSDLHIGKVVNRYPMLAEQRHVFEQVIGYIKTEKPGAVIIAGDVYDRAIPGVEAVRLFDDFLTRLAREDVAVMIVSGNHDSPERMNYASRLLSDRKLYLCGSFDGTLDKLVLSDEYGEVNFWLLPFVKPLSLREFFDDRDFENYGDALAAILETANIDYTARNVLVSHQYYTKTGVAPLRSDSELDPVGGLDAIDSGLIERFDYVALGHLHGAQSAGASHIRYSGSPVKYSFSEWKQKKSVSLVALNEKGSLDITPLPLNPIHDMREIKGEIDKLMSAEVSSLAGRDDYLRVVLTDTGEIIDPMGKLRSVYPNIMSLDFENQRKNIDVGATVAGAEKPEKLSPYDLFMDFFLNTQGSTMTGDQAEIVRNLLENGSSETGDGA
ncbi:MAG: exonuclease SbcCD subunit D [Treponema sp.]|nr:exonuclease SbcCD subunit D [Treponema sp.]